MDVFQMRMRMRDIETTTTMLTVKMRTAAKKREKARAHFGELICNKELTRWKMRCDDKLLVLFNKSDDLGLTFVVAR